MIAGVVLVRETSVKMAYAEDVVTMSLTGVLIHPNPFVISETMKPFVWSASLRPIVGMASHVWTSRVSGDVTPSPKPAVSRISRFVRTGPTAVSVPWPIVSQTVRLSRLCVQLRPLAGSALSLVR